ncbi:OmpA family protein [Microbulbifer sp. THAF38]|uniref:OmpA family protein n=1 Tax=Microbulbifer sp. THAF38 TaxID=2587856 RepID=UPI001267A661|nr:OmpA family protein [Microbulbifer sp. THAF38]QFT56000.1 Outer membrane porin F precursor [Microbulbifer sp. THAF38]
MNKSLISLGLATAVVSGCASTDIPKPLAEVEHQYQLMSSNEMANRHAATPLRAAGKSVSEAKTAWQDGNEKSMAHQVYLAERMLGVVEHEIDIADMEAQFKNADMVRAGLVLQGKNSELTQKNQELKELKKELEKMGSKQNSEGNVLTLGDVLFAFDDHKLQPGAKPTVRKVADFLSAHENTRVVIEGYTDSLGSEEYNVGLSVKRAQSIQKALVKAGVTNERITVKGYGESNPVASNKSAVGRQHNRRVEVVLLSENETYESPTVARVN